MHLKFKAVSTLLANLLSTFLCKRHSWMAETHINNMPVGQESICGRISFSSCPCFTASLAKTNGISEQMKSFARTENSSQIGAAPQEKRSLGNEIILGLMKK